MNLSNLLNQNIVNLRKEYLKELNSMYDVNPQYYEKILMDHSASEKLIDIWYEKLHNEPLSRAYQVYDEMTYFLDLWDSYRWYSRLCCNKIAKSEKIKNVKSFVDVGCGIGYSTTALKQIYHDAIGYGTNLKETKQWNFCQKIAHKNDWNLIESINEINHDIDLVFASEYFEHIIRPMEHIKHIIDKLKPKYMVIANSFNTKSIGHFETYKHENDDIDQKKISKTFNKFIRDNGYTDIKTGFWNNRPKVWVRNDA